MRRARRVLTIAVLASAGLLGSVLRPTPAEAQQGPNINPGRDCQVVRTCNFTRGAAVRGCLSSYTCRTCRLVPARCTIGSATKCQEMVCSWGG